MKTEIKVTTLDRDFSDVSEMLTALAIHGDQIATEKMAMDAKVALPFIARDSGGELHTQRWIWWGHAGLLADGNSFKKGDRVAWIDGHMDISSPEEQLSHYFRGGGPVPPKYSFVMGYGVPIKDMRTK
jgi:hypothetical protein